MKSTEEQFTLSADSGHAVDLAAGRHVEVARLTNETLRLLAGRLSPTTQHRLARSMLLSRALAGDAAAGAAGKAGDEAQEAALAHA